MSSDKQIIIIKDAQFQQGTSFALVFVFLLYNIIGKSVDFTEVTSTYPESSAEETNKALWTHHICWFLMLTIKIYFWTFVCLIYTFLILLLVLYLVLFVIKFDAGVFKQMGKGFKTDTLIKLSKEYVAQSEKQITTRDVCSLIFSFIFKKTKIFIGFGLITLVLAFTFSTIVVKPIHMKTQKSRLSNTRLFLTTLFMFTSSMMIMYIIVKSQQPTQ